jgi:hypothetical protein
MSLRKKLLVPAFCFALGMGATEKSLDYYLVDIPTQEQVRRETPELAESNVLERRMDFIIYGDRRTPVVAKDVLDRFYEDKEFSEEYSSLKRQYDSLNSLEQVIEARKKLGSDLDFFVRAGLLFLGIGSLVRGVVSIDHYFGKRKTHFKPDKTEKKNKFFDNEMVKMLLIPGGMLDFTGEIIRDDEKKLEKLSKKEKLGKVDLENKSKYEHNTSPFGKTWLYTAAVGMDLIKGGAWFMAGKAIYDVIVQ